jgi:hypothetical protein
MTAIRPAMSVVLATDAYETIRDVIDCLRRQDVRDRLEVVVATPAPDALRAALGEACEFGAVQVVRVDSLIPLGEAWSAGVRKATAPIVVIGETHSFPRPGWAAALIHAHEGSWGAVVPAFENANPDGALSWALFLSDYGAWGVGRDPGELDRWPGFNSSYSREALLAFGDRLPAALSDNETLRHGLHARGHRVGFAPGARTAHLNVSRLGSWLDERWTSGLTTGFRRARGWSPWRRLAYVVGGPLIPAVLLWRARDAVRWAARDRRLPPGTLPALALAAVVRSAGEVIAYAGGVRTPPEPRMTEYEIHKARYVGDAGSKGARPPAGP